MIWRYGWLLGLFRVGVAGLAQGTHLGCLHRGKEKNGYDGAVRPHPRWETGTMFLGPVGGSAPVSEVSQSTGTALE
jgi:hypothetical protein